MAREAAEVRLVRETLERVLLPATASTVLFDALQIHGKGLPEDIDVCLEFVTGALMDTLSERLGDAEAASITEQLELVLRTIQAASHKQRRDRRRPISRHDMPTQAITFSLETRPVFVLSHARHFADQLRAALGPEAITPVLVPDEQTLHDRLSMLSPALILIDAVSLPAIEPDALVKRLRAVPSQIVKAVWGTDVAYGQRLLEASQRHGVSLTPFDRKEGIAPLMDVLRSRSVR
ncbi:MAG: hypothetical protein AB8I08_13325 [Sandaracinaceae bacterium]